MTQPSPVPPNSGQHTLAQPPQPWDQDQAGREATTAQQLGPGVDPAREPDAPRERSGWWLGLARAAAHRLLRPASPPCGRGDRQQRRRTGRHHRSRPGRSGCRRLRCLVDAPTDPRLPPRPKHPRPPAMDRTSAADEPHHLPAPLALTLGPDFHRRQPTPLGGGRRRRRAGDRCPGRLVPPEPRPTPRTGEGLVEPPGRPAAPPRPHPASRAPTPISAQPDAYRSIRA